MYFMEFGLVVIERDTVLFICLQDTKSTIPSPETKIAPSKRSQRANLLPPEHRNNRSTSTHLDRPPLIDSYGNKKTADRRARTLTGLVGFTEETRSKCECDLDPPVVEYRDRIDEYPQQFLPHLDIRISPYQIKLLRDLVNFV